MSGLGQIFKDGIQGYDSSRGATENTAQQRARIASATVINSENPAGKDLRVTFAVKDSPDKDSQGSLSKDKDAFIHPVKFCENGQVVTGYVKKETLSNYRNGYGDNKKEKVWNPTEGKDPTKQRSSFSARPEAIKLFGFVPKPPSYRNRDEESGHGASVVSGGSSGVIISRGPISRDAIFYQAGVDSKGNLKPVSFKYEKNTQYKEEFLMNGLKVYTKTSKEAAMLSPTNSK